MDVMKIRMQISKTSLMQTIRDTLREIGIRGFYTAWTAAMLRQLTYSTARLGIYNTLMDLSLVYSDGLSYPAMVGIGMISGVVGAGIGTPTDVVTIRMIGDMKLPPQQRRNYRNAVVGLVDIAKTEGVTTLWRGAIPTMVRAAIVNGVQLGTYSRTKMVLKDTGIFEEGVVLQFLSAMVSSVAMSYASLPVDVAKTRIQNWTSSIKPPGVAHILAEVVHKEGFTSLWRGFLPYYSRAGPYSVVTMICMDQLREIYVNRFMSPND